jgi:hypothetical protein
MVFALAGDSTMTSFLPAGTLLLALEFEACPPSHEGFIG